MTRIVTTTEIFREEFFNRYLLIKKGILRKISYTESTLSQDTDDAVFTGLKSGVFFKLHGETDC